MINSMPYPLAILSHPTASSESKVTYLALAELTCQTRAAGTIASGHVLDDDLATLAERLAPLLGTRVASRMLQTRLARLVALGWIRRTRVGWNRYRTELLIPLASVAGENEERTVRASACDDTQAQRVPEEAARTVRAPQIEEQTPVPVRQGGETRPERASERSETRSEGASDQGDTRSARASEEDKTRTERVAEQSETRTECISEQNETRTERVPEASDVRSERVRDETDTRTERVCGESDTRSERVPARVVHDDVDDVGFCSNSEKHHQHHPVEQKEQNPRASRDNYQEVYEWFRAANVQGAHLKQLAATVELERARRWIAWVHWAEEHPADTGIRSPVGFMVKTLLETPDAEIRDEGGRMKDEKDPNDPLSSLTRSQGERTHPSSLAAGPAQELWEEAKSEISLQMVRDSFDRWVRPVKAVSLEDNVLTLRAPGPAACEYLEHRLDQTVRRTLAGIVGTIVSVKYVCDETPLSTFQSPATVLNSNGKD